jgi:hypothetical protein
LRNRLAALAVVFFAAHLLYLPPTLEDIDSINFALGVRDFDVARHQPHPPGYPVFIALGKASTALLQGLGIPGAAPRGLALLGVLAGVALIPLLFALYRRLSGEPSIAWWATGATVCAPLFWFTALRPLSDMTGLAFAVAAQVLLLNAIPAAHNPSLSPRTALIAGALLSGLAAGVRVQTVMLTAPVLLAALVWPGAPSVRDRATAAVATVAGALVWGIPLLAASGGLSGYLRALGTQAGEDFSGVVMLWTTRQARVAANAILFTFVWPWGTFALGITVVVLAILGFLRLGWRAPRALMLTLLVFGPYAVFHLLFHETATVRYALPLVLPMAFLAVYAAGALGPIAVRIAAVALAVASLVVTLPPARLYARDGSPAFRLVDSMTGSLLSRGSASGPPATLAMHAGMRRVVDWDDKAMQVIRAPHGREWLALIEHWKKESQAAVSFLADPRRTDLVLFDPQARTLHRSERWTFREMPYVAGTRPGGADWYTLRPPGWMLDRGWALTAEVAGVAEKEGMGPHLQPSVVWVRARADQAALIIGGRHVGAAGDPPVRLSLASDTQEIDTSSGTDKQPWQVAPGYFFRHVVLPAGTLAGSGYVPLRVRATAADGSARRPPVKLEQFDLQSDGTVMLGLVSGWFEPEYNPTTGQAWRWMSERAQAWIRPVGRDVTLSIQGESPLRYFDHAPVVKVIAAGVEVSKFTPSSDFTQTIAIPAKALAASGGLVTIESELWFSPSERGESADPRHLALRIYSVSVK